MTADASMYMLAKEVSRLLKAHRNIEISDDKFQNSDIFHGSFSNLGQLGRHLIKCLEDGGHKSEAEALGHVWELCGEARELGGLGIPLECSDPISSQTRSDVEFLVGAWLGALSSIESAEKATVARPLLHQPSNGKRPCGVRPMTLAEKILCHKALEVPSSEGVRAGDLVRVSVDWIMASEVAWIGMLHSMKKIGMPPRAWRNDRFWLVGDHAVDPRNYGSEKSRMLMQEMEKAKRELNMTENQGSNYTILHTEFVRERAEPGMLVLGADSHTCSAGAVGCLAIGLGAGDVMIGLATGQTWFKVPESIRINFTGTPAWYIRGKDVVLSILRALRRNTYAADRVVEFGGPSAKYLSCDGRFAVCNMCTELGAITGVFVPDETTKTFVQGRKVKSYKSNSVYFAPDEGAEYAATFDIDLSQVESYMAIYPSPDDVHPVREKLGMRFDGCFIGACTTTEEDLMLAALVLDAGLKKGLTLAPGKRIVVPGSLPIVHNLRRLGLLDIYRRAGFEQPAPGCSLCIGMGADVAEDGSHWLSSQNRNFKNRMGKGAVGHICSAATVAASSFDMTLTDPTPLLLEVSESTYKELLADCKSWRNERRNAQSNEGERGVQYVEPDFRTRVGQVPAASSSDDDLRQQGHESLMGPPNSAAIRGKIYRMGDFVDTDAIIPAPFCSSPTDELLGSHCFEYVHPDFRQHVGRGYTVVVGGKAFGCGSSREEAARALKGLGVQCVIAKSFSFIFGRNMPTIGLLGFTITDAEFYRLADMGDDIEVNLLQRCVHVAGKSFPFRLDDMELQLVQNQGLAEAYRRFSNNVYEVLCHTSESAGVDAGGDATSSIKGLRNETLHSASRDILAW